MAPRIGLLLLVATAAGAGCDLFSSGDSGSCDGRPPAFDETLEGVSWLCVGSAGATVLVPGPERAELIIPAGALASDTKVVIRRPRQADTDRLDLRIEPASTVLARPAALRFAPVYGARDLGTILAYHASDAHPVRESDAETSDWRHAEVVSRDLATGSFEISLASFGGVFLAFAPADRAVLVPELPPEALRPGDVLSWLTELPDEPGPSWLSGHAALFACHGARGDVVLDVTPRRGVCMRSLDDLAGDGALTWLGARRPIGFDVYEDEQRRAVIAQALDAASRPRAYAMAGAMSAGAPSSASFVEDALDAADRGLLASVPGFWGSIPHGTFADTEPVQQIWAPHDEELALPISLHRMRGDLRSTGQFRGAYAVGGVAAAEGLPEGATFTPTSDGRYVLGWRPAWTDVGTSTVVTVTASGEVAPGVPYDASLDVEVFVPGIRFSHNTSRLGSTFEYYAPVPEGAVMGEYRLLVADTGEPVPNPPFPGHQLTILHVGESPTDPGHWGITFRLVNLRPRDFPFTPRQSWLFVYEYSGRWQGPAECEPDPDCRVGGRVNSVADAADADPGDGVCDTGSRVASGDPECTLRAAIEQANAGSDRDTITFDIAGAGPHVIAPRTPLPAVQQSLTIDGAGAAVGGAHGIVVDGSAVMGTTSSDGSGLLVESGLVEVRGLAVRGFSGAGIRNATSRPLALDSVDIGGNCGWGVLSDGAVTLTDAAGLGTVVHDNGTASGCEGGGVFSSVGGAATSAILGGATIADNGGAGLLTLGRVTLRGDNTISGNDGEGLRVTRGGPTLLGSAVRMEGGRTTISGNRGHGLVAEEGDLEVPLGSSLQVTANVGWGVFVDNGVARIGDDRAVSRVGRTTIDRNGVGGRCRVWGVGTSGEPGFSEETCDGGGIFANTHDEREAVMLIGVDVRDNGGPGVLVAEGLTRVGLAQIERNRGPGVGAIDGTTGNLRKVWLGWGDVVIRDNDGPGILCTFGGVHADYGAHLVIAGNASWGIFAPYGVVTVDREPFTSAPTARITGNGGGSTCAWWDLGSDGLPHGGSISCAGGGVFAEYASASDVHALGGVEVRANVGAGILVVPSLRLEQTSVLENLGPGVVLPDDPFGVRGSLTVVGPCEISANQGAGIDVARADVSLHAVTVARNAGTGVTVADGDLTVPPLSTYPTRVDGNGAGPMCYEVHVVRAGVPALPRRDAIACGSGGVFLANGSVDASQLDAEGNAGDGVRASGDVRITAGRICNNTDAQVAAGGTLDVAGVTTTCP